MSTPRTPETLGGTLERAASEAMGCLDWRRRARAARESSRQGTNPGQRAGEFSADLGAGPPPSGQGAGPPPSGQAECPLQGRALHQGTSALAQRPCKGQKSGHPE